MNNFEEHRKHPRFNIDCPISILLSTDELAEAGIVDISLGGIQIKCDHASAVKIKHEYESNKQKHSTVFQCSFLVHINDKEYQIDTVCKMIYILKRAEDVFSVGLEFIEMQGNSMKYTKQFIDSLKK